MSKFEVWCNEWYEKNDCCSEDKNTCPVRMAYEDGLSGEEAIRECAERSTSEIGGKKVRDKKIQLTTTIGLLLLDSITEDE